MNIFEKLILPFFVLALLAMSPDIAEAQGRGGGPGGGGGGPGGGGGGPGGGGPGGGGGGGGGGLPPIYAWMHPDVGLAFDPNELGGSFTGVGSHMVILDNFSRGSRIRGNLTGKRQRLYHGQWTSLEARLIAPGASHTDVDNLSGGVISDHFSGAGLQSVNLSFGLLDPAGTNVNAPGYSLGTTMWDSLVTGAAAADAVYAKAAGNEGGVAVDGYFSGLPYGILGNVQDSLNLQLIGEEGAIFVGALDRNGSTSNPAPLASYSTYAGAAAASQYVVVGVESGITGLSGTSFAAPIVTGYAAIIGDKFESASPAAVVDQLLATARTDTILNYNSTTHGMGEACLSCSLAPNSIPN